MDAKRVRTHTTQEPWAEPSSSDPVDRARLGDQEAFARLVEMHQHEVFTLALRLVADRELAADITQNALIRAWRAMPSFRGEARFTTWLHRITVNTAYSTRRRWQRWDTSTLDDMPEIADGAPGPERHGVSAHLNGVLHDALMQLSPSLRSVVVLKDVYQWSHPEIAAHLGITVTAAKVRTHRARKQLRQILETHLGDEAGGDRS